jgi:trimethylamine:corrinoid methyltransferase-like protein
LNRLLAEYESPSMEPAINEALEAHMSKRKEALKSMLP